MNRPEPPGATRAQVTETQAARSRHPRVLLVSTMPWMFPARLADSFHQLGFHVEAICHWGHPIRYLKHPIGLHRLGWLAETSSIETAIEKVGPDLVVPCDDPAVGALHTLHRRSRVSGLPRLMEKSIGDPAGFAIARKRSALVQVARSMDLLVPHSELIKARRALSATAARIGYPCVLKRDLTWSGYGTETAKTALGLRSAWSRAAGYTSGLRAGRAVFRDRRPRTILDWFKTAAVEAQEFVPGIPANRAVLCQAGRVVAGLSVEALLTAYPGGPASVVRVIDHKEMADTVAALVGRLGLSGFCGFDFLIDPSGRAYLLELNPRATPITHLAVADGTHLPGALYREATGAEPLSRPSAIDSELIALFPTEWKRDRTSPFLKTAHHDLPQDQPGLLAKAGLRGEAAN